MIGWQHRRRGQHCRIRQPAGEHGFKFASARGIRGHQCREQRVKMPGRDFALMHQHRDLALVGGKALAHEGTEGLGFAVQATGLERLNPRCVGFDGAGLRVWTWAVLEVVLRRFHRVAAFATREQRLDTARPRLTSRPRWQRHALAWAMPFLVFGHVGSPARPRASGAVRSGEDRPCTPTLQAWGHRPWWRRWEYPQATGTRPRVGMLQAHQSVAWSIGQSDHISRRVPYQCFVRVLSAITLTAR